MSKKHKCLIIKRLNLPLVGMLKKDRANKKLEL
jgi:hypothetical protein